jgi:hypothetical protein
MFNNLLRKFFSYSSSCDEEIGTYNCDPCPLTSGNREFGRVRGVALIKESYLATLLATPTTAATWQTGITNGNIIIIPMTAGSYDPGDPKELKGYGNLKSSYGTREMTLTWFDPNYKINYSFYNSINGATGYVPAFRTSSMVHIFDEPATITAKDAVDDDLESEVVWNGIAKVISSNLPSLHSAANLDTIFSCQ